MPRDNSGDDPHTIGVGKCTRDTDKALFVVYNEDAGQQWVPKSVVHDDSEIWKRGDAGKLIVKMWWAEKNILNNA